MKKRMLLLMVLAIAGGGCPKNVAEDEINTDLTTQSTSAEVASEEKLLQTVKEAVANILETMSDKDKNTVKNTRKEDLIKFHFGWGRGIRNDFGLWGNNDALLQDTGETHPDDASMVIIDAVWEELQKTK